jgi:hypothetical protein
VDVLGCSSRTAVMQDTTVHFHGADGTPLVGTLSVAALPRDAGSDIATHPTHCVLLLHGGMGHRDYLYHKHLTQRLLHAHGRTLAVFRFDYNGNGDRYAACTQYL